MAKRSSLLPLCPTGVFRQSSLKVHLEKSYTPCMGMAQMMFAVQLLTDRKHDAKQKLTQATGVLMHPNMDKEVFSGRVTAGLDLVRQISASRL